MRRALLLARLALARSRFARGTGARQFLYVPPHFQLTDPSIAGDIMAGQIVLAGRSLLTSGRSPFSLPAPSEAFTQALEGFQWLAHFDASGRPSIRDYARRLAHSFMSDRQSAGKGIEPPSTVARRVISWVTHSEMLTEGTDIHEYRQIMAQLDRDIVYLRPFSKLKRIGIARLEAAVAILLHALATDVSTSAIAKAEAKLERAVSEAILGDGATADRNAATTARLASDFVPLLALYRARNVNPPAFIGMNLLRMVAFLRMMQHPDGGLALFNGAGLAPRDLVAEATRFASGRIPRRESAADAGFERLENEHGLLIVDNGASPKPGFGQSAGASALAFEFSTKSDRLIVNCGIPFAATGELSRIYRAGPAHSGITVNDFSIGRIGLEETLLGEKQAILRVDGQHSAPHRARDDRGETVTIGHDGLRAKTGYDVSRQLTLLDSGGLTAIDRLTSGASAPTPYRASLIFHLHPSVVPTRLSGGDAVVLRLPHQSPGRDIWVFVAPGHVLEIDESRCFEQETAKALTNRITLDIVMDGTTEIAWRLVPYRPDFA